jgi:hypothetical protein
LFLAGGQINPREALEIVRERVEGESMTPTWCSVDTRIGSLTVHLEEARVFDAEVYADEVGFGPDEFKEDHRCGSADDAASERTCLTDFCMSAQ